MVELRAFVLKSPPHQQRGRPLSTSAETGVLFGRKFPRTHLVWQ